MDKPNIKDTMEPEKQIISENNIHYFINSSDQEKFNNFLNKAIYDQKQSKTKKISLFIPKAFEPDCEKESLIKEAEIKGYFNGIKPLSCYSSFLNKKEALISTPEKNVIRNIISSAQKSTYKAGQSNLDNRFNISMINPRHKKMIHSFFNYIFEDQELVQRSIQEFEKNLDKKNIAGLFYNSQLIALSTILMNNELNTASIQEIYFTRNFKGLNFMLPLLDQLVQSLNNTNIKTIYTFTRALDPDRNRLFGIYGFNYAGTMINETETNGNNENMNIWYKTLKKGIAV